MHALEKNTPLKFIGQILCIWVAIANLHLVDHQHLVVPTAAYIAILQITSSGRSLKCRTKNGALKNSSINWMFHSMWNQLTLPTWPTWILLIFCQVNVPIKKWNSWKFYLMKGFKIMTAWTMDLLAWTANHNNLWYFETALIQPVLIVNISFSQIAPVMEC